MHGGLACSLCIYLSKFIWGGGEGWLICTTTIIIGKGLLLKGERGTEDLGLILTCSSKQGTRRNHIPYLLFPPALLLSRQNSSRFS